MFKKVAIVLSIIYFISAYPVQDEIDNLLENLQKSFDLAKYQSHAKILNAETLLNNTVVENDYTLHYNLRAEKELQKEKIDSLKNAATKKGVNIDDCLSFEKLVIYLDIKAFNESMLCTDLLVSTAQENLITKPNKITIFGDVVVMLKKEAQVCHKTTDPKPCLDQISSQINTVNGKIWNTVAKLEESVNDYVSDLQRSIKQCGTTALENYVNKLDVVTEQISDCVQIKA